jgi:hypothetical protein
VARPDIVPESAGWADCPQGIYLLPMSGPAARRRRLAALRASPAPRHEHRHRGPQPGVRIRQVAL